MGVQRVQQKVRNFHHPTYAPYTTQGLYAYKISYFQFICLDAQSKSSNKMNYAAKILKNHHNIFCPQHVVCYDGVTTSVEKGSTSTYCRQSKGEPQSCSQSNLVRRMEPASCEESLKELCLLSLEKKKFQGDLVTAFQYLKKTCLKWEGLLTRGCSDRSWGNGFQLRQNKFVQVLRGNSLL